MDNQTPNNTTATPPSPSPVNLTSVIEDLFLVLANKEKEVIVKRFNLHNKSRETLEKIGKSFNVTRERIRQIEKIALGKLRRNIDNTDLKKINILAKQILLDKGGISLENYLINEILKTIGSNSSVDSNIIKLALHIDSDLRKSEKTTLYSTFWHLQSIVPSDIDIILNIAKKILEDSKDVIALKDININIMDELKKIDKKIDKKTVLSALEVDKRFKIVEEGIGLSTWRHINPKSIRDKAYIVLKKTKKPLHFIEIANKIIDIGFDRKVVTVQAVHNELIRYEQFVLVGRGLYALKEWGYQEGTVADIIAGLLSKKSTLTKQQIIKGVLKQRQVKKGTISLNLQKNPQFERVSRALYRLAKK